MRVTVDSPEHAFAVFTSDLASWWPLRSPYGDRAQQMRNVFGSPDGWAGLLKRFAGTTAER